MNKPFQSFSLITLGCPKNQADSEVLAGQLISEGLEMKTDPEDADAILINTCGFINDAKEESIQAILEAVALKQKHHKAVYVWGCLSERYRDEIAKEIPEVDRYFGVEPFEALGQFFLGPAYRLSPDAYTRRVLTTPPHTAYLKIADGCNHQCSFCAIPLFKGPYHSRSVKSLLEEAEALVQRGVKEIMLIAQDTTYYGSDLEDQTDLPELITRLCQIEGLDWLRILYAHPLHVTDAFIETVTTQPKVCNYLDLPLQHISDPILQRMGRGMSQKETIALVQKLRTNIPDIVLRTAFIVGFPGETEKDFETLYHWVGEMRFERMGAFLYSPEEGTRAFAYEDMDMDVKKERYHRLMSLQRQIAEEHNDAMIGKTIDVLIDAYDAETNISYGRTYGDALEIDQNVIIEGQTDIGTMIPVRIESGSGYDLNGIIVNM